MLQVVERDGMLGIGQEEELAIAEDLGAEIYHAYLENDEIIMCRHDGRSELKLAAYQEAGVCIASWAAKHACPALLQTLRCLGADMSWQDRLGRTAAHFVSGSDEQAAATLCRLCDLKADLSIEDANRQTAAHAMALQGYVKAFEMLGAMGVDLAKQDAEGLTPMHIAAQHGHASTVHLLCNIVHEQIEDKHGRLPAHIAAEQGHCEVLQTLHDCGQSLEVISKKLEAAPVHTAASHNHISVFRLLYDLGYNLFVHDGLGRTLTHHVQTAEALLCLHLGLNFSRVSGNAPLQSGFANRRASILYEHTGVWA